MAQAGRGIILDNQAQEIDQAAVERGRAAYWAWEYATWVWEFGPGGHADSIWGYYQDARKWAEHYAKHPVRF